MSFHATKIWVNPNMLQINIGYCHVTKFGFVLTKNKSKRTKMCHKLSTLVKRIYLDAQELTK